MISKTNKLLFSVFIWVTSLVLVPVFYLIYWLVTQGYDTPIFPHITKASINTLVGIITSFSITMTGFIAAIGAYILSISHSPTFMLWRNSGYLTIFYNLYAVSIVFLLITFSLCILMLLSGYSLVWTKVILCLVIVNFIHISLLTVAAINQSRKSA
jgi:hypothetical protein